MEEYRYTHSVVSLPVIQNSAQSPETPKQDSTAEAVVPAAPENPPSPASEQDPTRFVEQKLIEGKVIEALQKVYDPEIPVNIYELGLIYGIEVKPDNTVHVKMTLTAPACPVAGSLPGEVERRIEEIPEVKSATVELVWDPPWSRDMMSETALLTLGII